jgi:carboxymethylenebutenolidase
MTVSTLTAKVLDGSATGRLVVPDGAGPFPLVVFFSDAGGIRPAMLEMAGHLERSSYAVLLPDPYWRHGDYAPFDARTVFSDPPERARLSAMIATVRPEVLQADTEALIAAIDDRRVRSEHLGVVGYCMGGRMAFVIASRLAERVTACAPIHAGGLVKEGPESPHRHVASLKAELYLGVADEDASCTPEHQAALREALDAAGVTYELEVHHGARHGFAVPDFPVYDAAAAARHWEKVLALFSRHVR